MNSPEFPLTARYDIREFDCDAMRDGVSEAIMPMGLRSGLIAVSVVKLLSILTEDRLRLGGPGTVVAVLVGVVVWAVYSQIAFVRQKRADARLLGTEFAVTFHADHLEVHSTADIFEYGHLVRVGRDKTGLALVGRKGFRMFVLSKGFSSLADMDRMYEYLGAFVKGRIRPNQSLEPTATAVTPPAAQEPRQP